MAFRTFLSLILLYEVAALWTPLPTYTELAHEYRDKGPWVAMIVGAFSAWLYFHLLLEGKGGGSLT